MRPPVSLWGLGRSDTPTVPAPHFTTDCPPLIIVIRNFPKYLG
jgi:hypothetical protein